MVVSILSLSRLPGVAFDGWEADVITLDTHESLYLARKAENESQLDLQHHRPQPLRPYLHQPRNTTNCFPAFQPPITNERQHRLRSIGVCTSRKDERVRELDVAV